MKGIILAGGQGSRLLPLTVSVSKQLLPVYDKPMIYYPLTTLMLAGIKEILIITTPRDQHLFEKLLGDGSQWGLQLSFSSQAHPNGIAEALTIGKKFIAGGNVALILGDNIFLGAGLGRALQNYKDESGATIFAARVANPKDFGVVELSESGNVLSIEEKPMIPKSDLAISGLYILDERASGYASEVKVSSRGELEIVSLLERYLEDGELRAKVLAPDSHWLDMGTHDSLLDAGQLVRTLQFDKGISLGNPNFNLGQGKVRD
tara:strand:- start:17271 stop:18056 length:786 start_codon:yes stop_codon:yes gene_type:complete